MTLQSRPPAPGPRSGAASGATPATTAPGLHAPSLAVGLVLMLGGTLDPRVLADSAGRADHGLAMLVFWAMSAGFVRGVGFVPRHTAPRWLLSGWACALALAAAAALKLLR